MGPMKRASFFALLYSDIFDYPLMKEELKKWQIKPEGIKVSKYQGIKVSKYKKNDFYFLTGREKIISLRKKREKISEKKIILAEKITKLLSKIPFVKMIAITGALAMKNSDEKDDIDLLIVTQKNRVWLTRFLATIFLELLGKRRRPNLKRFGNKICLNMFLDESNLRVPKKEQNLYSGHEVCQIKPVYNKEQTYERFLLENSWVDKYLPKARYKGIKVLRYQGDYNKSLILKSLDFILNLIEIALYKAQLLYMKSKITREVVEKDRILFHPRDTAKMVLGKFEERLVNW